MKKRSGVPSCLFLSFIVSVVIFLTGCKKEKDTYPVTDIDGNGYNSVIIGTQTWLVENLRTTKYNDGAPIPNVTGNTDWENQTSGACCWYENDASTYKIPYGALYNWHAVNTGKLCPAGWHVPSDDEWTELSDFLGGESVAGGKLKEEGTAHWISPNAGATNESGFTALPGGGRGNSGEFGSMGGSGLWWSSTSVVAGNAWDRGLAADVATIYRNNPNTWVGWSVRCIKDN